MAVDFAIHYLPAATQAGGVGGDWFDVIPLSGARVALVVGDVVGHGIAAAAAMGRVRTAVRTLADIDLPSDELLKHLDDVVLRLTARQHTDHFDQMDRGCTGVTCLYAVCDPVSRCCNLARAGHPPPLVITPGGHAELIDLPPNQPLGVVNVSFEAREVQLPEGSLLSLYTDGLVESREWDIDDGIRRLRKVLDEGAPMLEVLCDRALTSLLPSAPADDVALLIARTHALDASQVAVWQLPSNPAIVATARQQATEQLTSWGLGDAAFSIEVAVSELVTNAIRYGREPIKLRLIRVVHDDTCDLSCEVADGSDTAPHLRRADPQDEGGRGLFMVAQLTDHWGCRYTPPTAERSFGLKCLPRHRHSLINRGGETTRPDGCDPVPPFSSSPSDADAPRAQQTASLFARKVTQLFLSVIRVIGNRQ
ncbi:SpoIIE family protein phosphatase, partial [Streptomyces violaceusniger]|uniref:ATP-binding SpoIIE family protein phosphatase n=1 Tax=Streptomyces violaceusniger TaxID=68280 RepID=UPI0009C336F5|nr:PAS/PAC sensor protein [Streptomyces hygroscopicus]